MADGKELQVWLAKFRALIRHLTVVCFAIGPTVVSAEKVCSGAAPRPDNARPQVRTTPYESITPAELLAVYRDAYVEAGFKFKGKAKIGEYDSFRLMFEFDVPGFKRKGSGTIVFDVQLAQDGNCAPCNVYRETVGIPWKYDKDYDTEKQWKAEQVIYAADARANKLIKERLGVSLGNLLDTQQGHVRNEPC